MVIVPKCRNRKLYGETKRRMGGILRDLCGQREVTVVEGHLCADHVDMCLSIPPKYSVALVLGFLKGRSAIRIHRKAERDARVTGRHFWARGYCVGTVGLDEEKIRGHIREQEKLEADGQQMLDGVQNVEPQGGFPQLNAPLWGAS